MKRSEEASVTWRGGIEKENITLIQRCKAGAVWGRGRSGMETYSGWQT